ncbi:daptide-type RiPP biosynthesis dehydogenase [Polymorphospora rubra]|uniref:Alcohol dehydrogenase iron-type/glycerol dehydrogenase GldA domain-containing protein n=2 Tax=Polymorphospora rubra TaxID=338584 RepID=A0A810N5E9_9ACTN|nr:daptide-type RiPP biosynthesis dehydogenase [Polymorphospora rubra]BCJ68971.1 hypothetical protein Prubr_59920 [Polymorphospora rubra]
MTGGPRTVRVCSGWNGLDRRDLAGPTSETVTLLVDAAVAGAPFVGRVAAGLAGADADVDTLVLRGAGELTGIVDLAARIGSAGPVLAVGGGSLIDQAKLATVLAEVPDARRYLETPQRSGLVVLPEQLTRSRRLVVVPTTLGTGAEVSRVACLARADGKQLVSGEVLRPDLAVLLPEPLTTLPGPLLAEGVLEALFRTVGPYVGDLRDTATGDDLAERTAARLVALGDRAGDALRAGGRPEPDLLLEIVRLGGLSHLPDMHAGRDPFGARGWFLANELSVALGISKTRAIAALLPPLWQAIVAGDSRIGSAERLRRMWSRLRTAGRRTRPADPVAGITELLESWGIPRWVTADAARIDTAAHQATRAWGGGLPMLAGLRREDVRALLAKTVAAAA